MTVTSLPDGGAESVLAASPKQVAEHVALRMAEPPYRFYFRDVSWSFDNGVLTLKGRVATERLKHSLRSRLEAVPGVIQLVDQVDVISATGLSFVRPR